MAMRPGDDFDRDILDIIPERFDADADSHQARAGHRLRTVTTLVLAVLAVGGIVAAGWRMVGDKQPIGPGIPVIKADDRPIKVKPEDRGGMAVPNQDKLIYGRMDGESEPKTERLLPPPEQPQAPPRAEAVPAPPAPAPAIAQPLPPPEPQPQPQPPQVQPPAAPAYTPVGERPAAAKPDKPEKTAPTKVTPPPAAETPAPSPVAEKPAPAPVPEEPPGAERPQQSAALPSQKALPAGDWLVQLGAVQSPEAAEREWARIQKANKELLGGLKPDVMKAELEKGTFWRVRAGPLSEAAARQLCQELGKRKQGCYLVRK